ncbi:MAG: DNA polymerase I [Muribaculaceae bacterium]|nr:DNA polymerase I [Muribaculaceae bacterium]
MDTALDNKDKRLFLLDAYALIFRAYYALIKMPRITQSGFNTSAIFGFVNTLEEVLRRENPSHIAVCFDPQGPTFRSEAFKDYKGEREATPEDIKLSIPIIKDIIRAYNIPILEVAGFEADDVIGTMSKLAEKQHFTTYMMTPDKDFGQLVSPQVIQYKPSYRGQDFELRGEKEVCERYGLQSTSQVIDLLALMGDKIDNIPGCPGVGEKTAQKLIAEYGSVEHLLESTDTLKGALKKKIEENAEQIRFSKYLATIRTDVPLEATPDDLLRKTPDRAKLLELFDKLEFRALSDRVMRRLASEANESSEASKPSDVKTAPGVTPTVGSLFDFMDDAPAAAADSAVFLPEEDIDVRIVASGRELEEMQMAVMQSGEVGIYVVAADSDNDMAARWIGTALAVADKKGGKEESYRCWYVGCDFAEGMAALLDLFAREDILKVTDSAKLVYVLSSRMRGDSDVALTNFYDVVLAHYLLQPDMRHGLDLLASNILHLTLLPMPELAPRRTRKNTVAQPPSAEEIAPAAARRAIAVAMLRKPLMQALEEDSLTKLYEDIEAPLVEVLADMELTGVRIDVGALNEAAHEIESRLSDLEGEIHQLAGEEFNIGSPSKVGEILFDKLKLSDKAKKTKTGQYSTSEDILESVAHKNPIVGKILEYRQLKKLLTTYLTALPASINPATGRIHTCYNQTVTATGRISSSNPNLQNIPVREDVGREIRRAFIPSEGNLFLSADYSQIELRLVADFAQDDTMLKAFRDGDDIHAITAAKIYHKDSPDAVTADERRHAKTANFGILYGISAFGLASRLGIPRAEAKELIDNYFKEFHTIRKYMADAVEFAREHQYVETRMGRKRRLPDINSKNPVVRGYAERNAVNAPIQGSAADIIKRAMIDIYREMKEKGLKSKMIMQVHDELNFDVVPSELPQMQELVERMMERAYSGHVRLTASSGVASNWLDAH